MSKELNCMNCSIGDFKRELCDCNKGFCKEFKSIGKQEDFFKTVIKRIRPQGHYIKGENGEWYCSNCKRIDDKYSVAKFCWYCGAKMIKG